MKPDKLKNVSCHYFPYNSGTMTRKPISLYSWHTDLKKNFFFNFSLDVLHVPTDGWLFPKANSSLGDLVPSSTLSRRSFTFFQRCLFIVCFPP